MREKARKKWIGGFLLLFFLLSCALSAGAARLSQKAKAKPDGIVVPIMMYHEVKPFKTRKDVITPYEMESDLKYLKENGYTTITMTNLVDYAVGKGELPEKPIVLSFDDGYLNNYIYVLPLLKKYDAKIVLSIIGKNTDDFTRIPDKNLDYSHVTWGQINEMVETGRVEIQNHTYNLHLITRKRYGCQKNKGESEEHYEQVLTEDIGGLQKEITAATGSTPNTFTYPYGQVSPESYPVIKRLGFKASLTCDYGVNLITRNPQVLYGLKRVCRVHGVPIQKALQSVMKTLRYR